MVADAFEALRAFNAKDGDACSLIPGWTPLLTAFASAVTADTEATVHLSYELQKSPEVPGSLAAESAVKGIQLWAQALRTEQQAWNSAAFTQGEIDVDPV